MGYSLYAQVGIGSVYPDSLAVLDLHSEEKGFLIPRMSTETRLLLSSKSTSDENSILVFDTDLNAFFYLINGNWHALNGWDMLAEEDNADKVIRLNTNLVQRLGINATTSADTTMAVGGNVRIEGALNAQGVTVKGDFDGDGCINAQGNISTNVSATKFSTPIYSSTSETGKSGPVHPGSVIMWWGEITGNFDSDGLGIDELSGWALCDGQDSRPDLRDRFIVGAGRNYAKGDTGGAVEVTLTEAQMPSHTHNLTVHSHSHDTDLMEEYDSDDHSNATGADGESTTLSRTEYATSGVTFKSAGGGQAHNNLPPYYALVYIIKL